jgi:hypothetical protein
LDLSDDDDVHGYFFSAHFWFLFGYLGVECKLQVEKKYTNDLSRVEEVLFSVSTYILTKVEICTKNCVMPARSTSTSFYTLAIFA